MVFFSLRRLAIPAVLLLTLLSLNSGTGGMVLCLMPGGHIELESVLVGCCDPAHGDAHGSAVVSVSSEAGLEQCGACMDIPLSGITGCVSTAHAHGQFNYRQTVGGTVAALPVHITTASAFTGPQHQKARLSATVSSVNLRI